jgi:hypothetical protein
VCTDWVLVFEGTMRVLVLVCEGTIRHKAIKVKCEGTITE